LIWAWEESGEWRENAIDDMKKQKACGVNPDRRNFVSQKATTENLGRGDPEHQLSAVYPRKRAVFATWSNPIIISLLPNSNGATQGVGSKGSLTHEGIRLASTLCNSHLTTV